MITLSRRQVIALGLGLVAAVVAVALITVGLADSELFGQRRAEPTTASGQGNRARQADRPPGHAERIERRHQSGFPDASDTGVPAETELRTVPGQVSSGPGWVYDPRGWVKVYGDGADLSDLYIPHNVTVTASNVTIRNVRITVGGA